MKAERTRKQLDNKVREPVTGPTGESAATTSTASGSAGTVGPTSGTGPTVQLRPQPRPFHGPMKLDAGRTGRDARKVADEVLANLAGLVEAEVTVTLDISARIPDGVPDNMVRTVTENCSTLKFGEQGFESECRGGV